MPRSLCNFAVSMIEHHSKFDSLAYLADGTAEQKQVHQLLLKYGLLEILSGYHPILAGTLPLDINIHGSDLDIICQFNNKEQLSECLLYAFSTYPAFKKAVKTVNGQQTIIATFLMENWPVEIFCQQVPVKQQSAYQHMVVEHYLLQQHGEVFRQRVIKLKQQGFKTEPAFAKLLDLQGDPYQCMLDLYPIVVGYR
jgi:hypothetical protein